MIMIKIMDCWTTNKFSESLILEFQMAHVSIPMGTYGMPFGEMELDPVWFNA
jgi:hypothetical protein